MSSLFGEEFTDDMKYLGFKWMLDPIEFQKIRGFEPDIGSVFVVGGGSYSDDDEYLGQIGTVNGTLIHVDAYPDLDEISDIYYEEYRRRIGRPLKRE
jgi:hypothetical protein